MRTAYFVCSFVLLLPFSNARGASPSPSDLAWLRQQCGDGAVAYTSAAKIYLTELSTGSTETVGNGVAPEFSPDSSKLAWIDGTTAKGRARKGDKTVHEIATGVSAKAGVHWISNTAVVVVKSGKWRKVALSGTTTDVPKLTSLGIGGSETDVKLGSDGVWSYVDDSAWKTSDGKSGVTGGSCSSSLSPDGKSTTGLLHGHKECLLTQMRSGGTSGKLQWVYDFDGDKGFDNHRWSSNDARFVVAQDEKYNRMVVMKVGGTYATRIGKQGSGEMYGDFTVGDGSGAAWPGTGSKPEISLSKQALAFSAYAGGANPKAQEVKVTNGAGGTLGAVTAKADVGWLAVAVSGSGDNQTLSNAVDITGLAKGSHTATVTVTQAGASNSPQSYSVTLKVVEQQAGVHLRINCGDNSFTPSGWVDDDAFADGGTPHVFESSFSTSGLTDAAPAEVYRSCRHRIKGVESRFGYRITSLADGQYTLRLHFADLSGGRAIDVWVEGKEVISNLALAAGKAMVEELQIEVAGGDGLTLELTDDRSTPVDFFVNGIEVIGGANGNEAPQVDAGVDQLVELGVPVFLDGSATDDGLPVGSSLSLTWTRVSGPAEVTFSDPHDAKATAEPAAPGDYVLRLTADDGELEAHADVLITVAAEPTIKILSPKAGDVLALGQSHLIAWRTVGLEDMQIDFSSDNGATWVNITGSVDTQSPDWEKFPWTPDTPCEQCLIEITGYDGDAPTTSGLFSIRESGSGDSTSTEDPFAMRGGCAVTPTTTAMSFPLIVLLGLLLVRRRR